MEPAIQEPPGPRDSTELRRADVIGCVYPNPVPDDGDKLPERIQDLRVFQIKKLCPTLVGLPIYMSHLTEPRTPTDLKDRTNAALGHMPLGKVTDSWIDPETNALHWRGKLQLRRGGMLDKCIQAGTLFQSCSLTHQPADPVGKTDAKAIEISICTNPLRKGASIQYSDCTEYMRKYGHPIHGRKRVPTVIMASAAQDPLQQQAQGGVPGAPTPNANAVALAAIQAMLASTAPAQALQQTPPQVPQQAPPQARVAPLSDQTQSDEILPEHYPELLGLASKKLEEQDAELAELRAIKAERDRETLEDRKELWSVVTSVLGENHPTAAAMKAVLGQASDSTPEARALWSAIAELAGRLKQQKQAEQLAAQAGDYGSGDAPAKKRARHTDQELASAFNKTKSGGILPDGVATSLASRLLKKGFFPTTGGPGAQQTGLQESGETAAVDGTDTSAYASSRQAVQPIPLSGHMPMGSRSGFSITPVASPITLVRASGAYSDQQSAPPQMNTRQLMSRLAADLAASGGGGNFEYQSSLGQGIIATTKVPAGFQFA